MSGSHVPHLQRRNGIYHLRVRVPNELRLRVGMLEVTRSLKTPVLQKARLFAAIFGPRVMEAFAMIKSGDFSRDDARQLVGVVRLTFATCSDASLSHFMLLRRTRLSILPWRKYENDASYFGKSGDAEC